MIMKKKFTALCSVMIVLSICVAIFGATGFKGENDVTTATIKEFYAPKEETTAGVLDGIGDVLGGIGDGSSGDIGDVLGGIGDGSSGGIDDVLGGIGDGSSGGIGDSLGGIGDALGGIAGGIAGPSLLGILLGLGSGIGYALYSIFSRMASNKHYDTYTIIFYSVVLITIVMLPFANIGTIIDFATVSPVKNVFFLFFHSTCATVLPYVFLTLGVKHMEAGTASILASGTEPVAAVFFGMLFYMEIPTVLMIVGLIVTIVALAFLCKSDK